MKYTTGVLALLASWLLPGCINLDPVADTTNFYILGTDRYPNNEKGSQHLLVRNLELADYLRNSQLAQREGSNRITYHPNHRWAGPLDKMIAETIAEVISLSSADMSASTMTTGNDSYLMDVKVIQFDFTAGVHTTLLMEYTVINAGTRELVRRDWIRHHQKISDDASMEEIVNALELTLRSGLEALSIQVVPATGKLK